MNEMSDCKCSEKLRIKASEYPIGHENKALGSSSYNWLNYAARVLDDLQIDSQSEVYADRLKYLLDAKFDDGESILEYILKTECRVRDRLEAFLDQHRTI